MGFDDNNIVNLYNRRFFVAKKALGAHTGLIVYYIHTHTHTCNRKNAKRPLGRFTVKIYQKYLVELKIRMSN